MKKFISLFAALFGVLLLAWPAYAADIRVSSDCSLADAITAANQDEAAGGCPAGNGADTIALSADVRLSRALPLVTSEITIEGGGHTIRGNRLHIFGVHSRGNLTLNEVTITNGRAAWGGAIGNFGILTISNSIIRDNSAGEGGAIGNEGILTVRNSAISNNTSEEHAGAIDNEGGTLIISNSSFTNNSAGNNGGAIFSSGGKLSISQSTFSDNSADKDGGVIRNRGELSISQSSFNGNSADKYGGAIDNFGELSISQSSFNGNSADKDGGAIHNLDELSISNSSFSGNSAGKDGGAIDNWDGLSVNNTSISNSSFSGNSAGEDGGGIHTDTTSTVYLTNSIIAGSIGSDCFGRLAQSIGNLIEDGSCFAELVGDPMLGELVTPGDGSPAYFPLLEGSPSIDAANRRHCSKTDQIGTARPQGAGCDIGAIEYTGKVSISSGG